MLSLYMIAFGEMLRICIFNRLLGIFFNNDSGVSVDNIAAFGVFGGFFKNRLAALLYYKELPI